MESIKEIVARNCRRLLVKPVNLAELSRLMQIHPSTISRWKNGDHAPEMDKIDKLADLLGVDPLEFYRTESNKPLELPVSKTLQKMMCVPDKIYDLAIDLGADHGIWEGVEGMLEQAIEDQKSKASRRAKV
jgi:transcriptional regulator with XRE-family HTH domain